MRLVSSPVSLDIRLRKPGVYTLNENGAEPSALDVATGLHRAQVTAWTVAVLFALLMLPYGA